MFNPTDGLDPLRAFIMKGIMRDQARARRMQQLKAPHANPMPFAKPHFDGEKVEGVRRAQSIHMTAPHGRLFKGHRP
ncbi:hypothetical protein P67b_00071 [Ruegeria phage Tedan]|nr:hypothetical protein P67b_00071 [Ruegeria phage Tedan]